MPTKLDKIRLVLKVYDIIVSNLPHLTRYPALVSTFISKCDELAKDIPHILYYKEIIMDYVDK